MPAELYRHFDKVGDLLYIGVSKSAFTRASQHKFSSTWFRDIATIAIEHHKTRASALSAERKAIINERPKYNIDHKINTPKSKPNPKVERVRKSAPLPILSMRYAELCRGLRELVSSISDDEAIAHCEEYGIEWRRPGSCNWKSKGFPGFEPSSDPKL